MSGITSKHFDEAVFRKIGGELVDVVWPDGSRRYYAARVVGVDGPDRFNGMIPVIYRNPEERVMDYLLPCFCVVPGAPDPDPARMQGAMEGTRAPASGAAVKTITRMSGEVVSGYDAYTTTSPAWPFNLPYEIECRGKKKGQERDMFLHLLKTFPLNRGFVVATVDGDSRSYSAFLDGTSDLTEIADVVNRVPGKSISIRVEGEIDLMEPSDSVSCFVGVTVTAHIMT
jgi:hypothetical protein